MLPAVPSINGTKCHFCMRINGRYLIDLPCTKIHTLLLLRCPCNRTTYMLLTVIVEIRIPGKHSFFRNRALGKILWVTTFSATAARVTRGNYWVNHHLHTVPVAMPCYYSSMTYLLLISDSLHTVYMESGSLYVLDWSKIYFMKIRAKVLAYWDIPRRKDSGIAAPLQWRKLQKTQIYFSVFSVT